MSAPAFGIWSWSCVKNPEGSYLSARRLLMRGRSNIQNTEYYILYTSQQSLLLNKHLYRKQQPIAQRRQIFDL